MGLPTPNPNRPTKKVTRTSVAKSMVRKKIHASCETFGSVPVHGSFMRVHGCCMPVHGCFSNSNFAKKRPLHLFGRVWLPEIPFRMFSKPQFRRNSCTSRFTKHKIYQKVLAFQEKWMRSMHTKKRGTSGKSSHEIHTSALILILVLAEARWAWKWSQSCNDGTFCEIQSIFYTGWHGMAISHQSMEQRGDWHSSRGFGHMRYRREPQRPMRVDDHWLLILEILCHSCVAQRNCESWYHYVLFFSCL